MERKWKIEVNLETGILHEIKDSIIKNLQKQFTEVEVKRRVGTPSFILNEMEVNILHSGISIYTDDIDQIEPKDISFLVSTFYKSEEIGDITIGTKKLVKGDLYEVKEKIEFMFPNNAMSSTIFLSSVFAKLYENEIVIYNISLNTQGYQIQIECKADYIEQIKNKVYFIRNLLKDEELLNMMSIGDANECS